MFDDRSFSDAGFERSSWLMTTAETPISGGGGRLRYRVPPSLLDAQAMSKIDEDDTLLLMAATFAAGAGWLQ